MTKLQLKKLKEGDIIKVDIDGKMYNVYFISFEGIAVLVSTTRKRAFGSYRLVNPEDIHMLSALELELL